MVSEELLRTLYYSTKRSQQQIATQLGVSRAVVQRACRRYGIQARGYAEASSNMNDQRKVTFTPNQVQLILGSLLGDACIYHNRFKSNKTDRIIDSLKLVFSHCAKQKEYLEHKHQVIGGSRIGWRVSGYNQRNGSRKKQYVFTFSQTPSLRWVADLCLADDCKTISEDWLQRLDWQGIAYWYQDDGSLLISKKRPMIIFHTNSFKPEELTLLQKMLLSRFGLETKRKVANKNPNQLLLVSRRKLEVTPFLEQVAPYIVPCLRYKLRWLDYTKTKAKASEAPYETIRQAIEPSSA